jgi:uncharacterized protein YbjT (DUF2867 family)
MRDVVVDPVRRRARVGAGAVWHDVVEAAASYGLAGLPGSSNGVGVVGYTLGGGFGWLGRHYGLAAHSVTRAELVTATGELLAASAEEDPELLWGLLGGAGNVGIVTSLEFRLHPVARVYGGNLYYPLSRARDVLGVFADWTREAPDELTAAATFRRFPPLPTVPTALRGRSLVALRGCFSGDLAEGEALVDRARRVLGPALLDTFAPMRVSALASISADPVDPLGAVQHSETIPDVTPELVEVLLDLVGRDAASPLVMLELRTLGGALVGPRGALSPMAHTEGVASLNAVGVTTTPAAAPEHVRSFLRELRQRLRPHVTGETYVNFLDLDGATPERVRASYSPADWERLARLKARLDPDNLFRFSRTSPQACQHHHGTRHHHHPPPPQEGPIMNDSITRTTGITSTTGTILVTGATGTVGAAVVERLGARGARTRAFVRDPERARARLGDDVELVVGDLGDPDSIRTALRGVDTVFLACGNVPDQVPHELSVIEAASGSGVGRLVKLSARGADARASNAYWRAHAQIESRLETSDIPSVVLRPSFLMSNLFAAAEHIRGADTLMAPAGSARIAMVDPADVAEVAALALTDTAVRPGGLVLTGPGAIGYQEVAGELSAVLGRRVSYVDVPPGAMLQGLVAAGVPEGPATEVVAVFGALRAGDPTSATGTVADLTGRPAGSFADFARRHASVFDPSAASRTAHESHAAGAHREDVSTPLARGA